MNAQEHNPQKRRGSNLGDIDVSGVSKNENSLEVGDSSIGEVYPGDLVVYRSKHPWEWSPMYGTVMARHEPSKGNLSPQAHPEESTTKNDNDGLPSSSASKFTVHWDNSNRVRQMKRSEVSVVDRMLVRGTRVRNAEGTGGTVINYTVKATLQIVGTNRVIQNVPITDLQPISPYVRGQEILFRHWVGVVTNVKRKVWFRFDSGLTFHIETVESDGFMKTDPYWGLGVACPGVRTPFSAAILKNAKWGSKYMKILWKWLPPLAFLYSLSNATVTKVEASSINVKWLAPAPNSTVSADIPPPTTFEKSHMDEMQVLSMPNSEYAGLNSVRIYKVKPNDNLTTYGAWFSRFRYKFMEKGHPKSPLNLSDSSSAIKQENLDANGVPVKILLRTNFVDILWDDGKKERMPTVQVPFAYDPKSYENLRVGMVVAAESGPPDSKRYGIIQVSEDLVEAGTNTVRVHWFSEGSHRERVVLDEGVTEESIYCITPHPKYSLFQRETILFSVDSDLHEFQAGVVIDVDVRHGNMIIFCTDNRYRKVWPHMVTPFSKRCSWNFFTRKWVVDDIIPPPHQLGTEYYPKNMKLSSKEVEDAMLKLKTSTKVEDPWEDLIFDLLQHVPESHWYLKSDMEMVDENFRRQIRNEFDVIRSTSPEGIWIRIYEDRMDLASVMISGPARTPYEGGLFFFDVKLPKMFPKTPPQIHFVSYGGEMHPCLGEDGNFCEANLNWKYDPADDEVNQPKSYILEAAKAIQGLFYTTQPYFAGIGGPANAQQSTPETKAKARAYNEMVFLQVLNTYYQAALRPHDPWRRHIRDHINKNLAIKVAQIENLMDADSEASTSRTSPTPFQPSYPLVPVSKGFKMALQNHIRNLKSVLANIEDPAKKLEANAGERISPKAIAKQSSSANLLMSTLEEIMHEHKHNPRHKETLQDVDVDDEEVTPHEEPFHIPKL